MTCFSIAVLMLSTLSDFTPKVQVFDLRERGARTDGNDHSVVFSARQHDLSTGDVGHVWVTWVKRDRSGKILDTSSFGFYLGRSPKKDKICAFDCPPKLVSEIWKAKTTGEALKDSHRIVVHVDHIPYLRSKQKIGKWTKEAENYDVLSNSCKHFVSDVAKDFGIEVAISETDWPETHLEKLIEAATDKYGTQ